MILWAKRRNIHSYCTTTHPLLNAGPLVAAALTTSLSTEVVTYQKTDFFVSGPKVLSGITKIIGERYSSQNNGLVQSKTLF